MSPRPLRRLLPLALLGLSAAPLLPAQELDTAAARSLQARASLEAWARAFSKGVFTLRDELNVERRETHEYLRLAFDSGLLQARRGARRTTHMAMLHRLVGKAEVYGGPAAARGLLTVAAAGFDGELYGRDVMEVRSLAIEALARLEDAPAWEAIRATAAGKPRSDRAEGAPEGERVAALRLLARAAGRNHRPTLERCLADPLPRVRLAAAEALFRIAAVASLDVMQRAARVEKHPLVAHALLLGLDRILRLRSKELDGEAAARAVGLMIDQLGRVSWRMDMSIVRLARRHPQRSIVPAMIAVLERGVRRPDPLLKLVNQQASPLLKYEAWQTLRQCTGAILPQDPKAWREFWARERERVELVPPAERRADAGRTVATGGFFGIPVRGSEVIFLIDASGSMAEQAFGTAAPVKRQPGRHGARRKPKARAKDFTSRLDAAKQQMLQAVEGMPDASRYHLMTFNSGVHLWNARPVAPNSKTRRALAEALSKIHSNGGTNLYGALRYVLSADQMQFGKQVKARADEVFLLSDGLPSTGEVRDTETILKLVDEMNRYQQIRINTVFTGRGEGADFLARLARRTGGVFVRR